MVFKRFLYVFFTTSLLTPYSVVNNIAYAIYGVLVLFVPFYKNTLAMKNHKRYYVYIYE